MSDQGGVGGPLFFLNVCECTTRVNTQAWGQAPSRGAVFGHMESGAGTWSGCWRRRRRPAARRRHGRAWATDGPRRRRAHSPVVQAPDGLIWPGTAGATRSTWGSRDSLSTPGGGRIRSTRGRRGSRRSSEDGAGALPPVAGERRGESRLSLTCACSFPDVCFTTV